jgi:hypothetical protein
MTTDLQDLGRRLVGRWTTEGTHPQLPGVLLSGSSEVEWLVGEQFLVLRNQYDHPEIPDAISIIGDTGGLRMHYFDARGVHRLFELAVTADGWSVTMRRGAPGSYAAGDAPFSQRISYTFSADDQTMTGGVQLAHDDETWEDDLEITYTRAG